MFKSGKKRCNPFPYTKKLSSTPKHKNYLVPTLGLKYKIILPSTPKHKNMVNPTKNFLSQVKV